MATDFWSKQPENCGSTTFDDIRKEEYPQLDEQAHVYLDYAGSGLASKAQIQACAERMRSEVAGNPHSISPASDLSNTWVDATRERVLKFLNACPEEYAVIFTANATGAARLVGEGYSFTRRSALVLTADNHNSINGLRCFASQSGAKTVYVPVDAQELRIDTSVVDKALAASFGCWFRKGASRGLFAYPAQSNFSGVRHPLSWVQLAQDHGFDVLLDAAAYLPTMQLDLSRVKPEFLIISWYKLFGCPAGIGCLVAKRSSLSKLSRPWFSGGTVDGVMVQENWHALAEGEARFEDGTLNFLSIPDVRFGLDWFGRLDLKVLATRLSCLTDCLVRTLRSLHHESGLPVVKIHGPLSNRDRGATVAFNVFDSSGERVDERLVGLEAARDNISIRVGCFCNPGANEVAQGTRRSDLRKLSKTSKAQFEQVHSALGRPLAGAVRVSLGIASNLADVEALLRFIDRTYKNRATDQARTPEKPPLPEA